MLSGAGPGGSRGSQLTAGVLIKAPPRQILAGMSAETTRCSTPLRPRRTPIQTMKTYWESRGGEE
jgi:hypothetical protein